ncbi:MAG: hypothetical protein V3U75_00390 [Methylococcaceae bacterium]
MKLATKQRSKHCINSALSIVLLSCWGNAILADGTETLGQPSIPVASGNGIVAAGTGLVYNPGMIEIDVPGEIKQALLYWECQMDSDAGKGIEGDNTIEINGYSITGSLIGGPTNFFRTTYSSTFRADISKLKLLVPGNNALTVDGLDCTGQINPSLEYANNGAGLMVIYDDGSKAEAEIQLRDGNDLSAVLVSHSVPTTNTTVPQTFIVEKAQNDRMADLLMFFSSVSGTASGNLGFRPSAIEVTVGGNKQVFDDLLDSHDGEEWDTVKLEIAIPANETMVTVQALSVDNEPFSDPGFPASFAWTSAALSVVKEEEICGRMKGGGKIKKTHVTHGFSVSCDLDKPNRLQVNWGKYNRFRLTSLDEAVCNDDPAIKQRRNKASFDTIYGKGTGRYNGVDGAKVEFAFIDAGRRGRRDISEIKITDAKGKVVLEVAGSLRRGNHQAQGCTNNSCSWKANRKHGWHRRNHDYQRGYSSRSHHGGYSSRKWNW